MLERWYANPPASLADFTIQTTIELARELGLDGTQFVRSSTLGCEGSRTERTGYAERPEGTSGPGGRGGYCGSPGPGACGCRPERSRAIARWRRLRPAW